MPEGMDMHVHVCEKCHKWVYVPKEEHICPDEEDKRKFYLVLAIIFVVGCFLMALGQE